MYDPDSNYIDIVVRVPFPTHSAIINYLSNSGWTQDDRYLSKDGDKFIWSKWSKPEKGFVRVLESNESVSYKVRQKEVLEIVARIDGWRDEYQCWQYMTGLDAVPPAARLTP